MVIALTVILKKKMGISVSRQDFWPRREATGQIVRIGLPIALQDGLIQVAFIIITIIANRRGLSDAAAVGIVEKIISFLFLVPSSMLSAVSALGAQNIGAGKPERAVRTLYYSIGITVGFGVIISIIIQFVVAPVVGLFYGRSSAVVVLGTQYIQRIHLGLHFCGHPFQFQRLFLCDRQIGTVLYP
ncbi:MAG: MATE family efflux transporter [Eubacterium sp.]